ncbi:hypothetical protein L596_028201 [Steinernema carpocapsae]|uniref:Uncharacterized protein n=1 Tax=Steinernema carpocapsae TaxID=34508 RepID=A0A4U5LXQ5_STECR|nr:hypothetical protein L596_028201 [Steinernema carpocapsae]
MRFIGRASDEECGFFDGPNPRRNTILVIAVGTILLLLAVILFVALMLTGGSDAEEALASHYAQDFTDMGDQMGTRVKWPGISKLRSQSA